MTRSSLIEIIFRSLSNVKTLSRSLAYNSDFHMNCSLCIREEFCRVQSVVIVYENCSSSSVLNELKSPYRVVYMPYLMSIKPLLPREPVSFIFRS